MLTGALCFLAMLAIAHGAVCEDAQLNGSCYDKMSQMATASSDIQRLCSIVTDAIECFESAMDDCKANGHDLAGIDTVMDQIKRSKALCKGSSNTGNGDTGRGDGGTGDSGDEIPKKVSCMDITKCHRRQNELMKYFKDGMKDKACPIAKAMVECTKTGVDDCAKTLPKESMDPIKEGYEMILEGYNKECGACAITQTTLFMAIFSALAIVVVRLF